MGRAKGLGEITDAFTSVVGGKRGLTPEQEEDINILSDKNEEERPFSSFPQTAVRRMKLVQYLRTLNGPKTVKELVAETSLYHLMYKDPSYEPQERTDKRRNLCHLDLEYLTKQGICRVETSGTRTKLEWVYWTTIPVEWPEQHRKVYQHWEETGEVDYRI